MEPDLTTQGENHHYIEKFAIPIVILLAIGAYFLFFNKSASPVDDDPNKVVNVSQKEILSDFPFGLPIEAGIEADASYRFTPVNSSERQSTISYTSKKSFEENSTIFANFLTSNNYNIQNEIDEPGLRFFYASKETTDLSINIEEKSGKIYVGISFLKK